MSKGKKDRAKNLLREDPSRSDSEIARELHCSRTLVYKARKELEEAAAPAPRSHITGTTTEPPEGFEQIAAWDFLEDLAVVLRNPRGVVYAWVPGELRKLADALEGKEET